LGEFLDEDVLVGVRGQVGLLEAAQKLFKLGRVLGGEEVRLMGCHRKFLSTFSPITWWGWTPKLILRKL
jgi:hypothetical protein